MNHHGQQAAPLRPPRSRPTRRRRRLEHRLERAVERTAGRLVGTPAQPSELALKLEQHLDDHRTPSISGRAVVPNRLTCALNQGDLGRLEELFPWLGVELATSLTRTVTDQGWSVVGPVVVMFRVQARTEPGTITVTSRFDESTDGSTGRCIELASGSQIQIGRRPLIIGRAATADLGVESNYASSRHARLSGLLDDLVIEDLDSTNGTMVNGQPVRRATSLRLGDVISVPGTTMIVVQ